MGFISTTDKVESINFVTERSLVNDLWIILEGHVYNGLSARNLLVCLLAILGLHVNVPNVKFPLPYPASQPDPSVADHARPLLKDSDSVEEGRPNRNDVF
jgi:hypothetical protein